MVEGVGEIPWFLFCPFLEYLKRFVLQTCYVDKNHHFLTYSAKNPAKIPCFYDFLAKKWILLIFTYIFNASQCPRARWLYDVTATWYEVQWYSFWYQWIEEVHTYTLVANIGVLGVPYRKSKERVATTPPLRRTCYKKYLPRRTRVNHQHLFNVLGSVPTFQTEWQWPNETETEKSPSMQQGLENPQLFLVMCLKFNAWEFLWLKFI